MPHYRRKRVEGGTYFFTLVLADRRSDLLVQEVAALCDSVSRVRALYPFGIDAWVVLPEHLHAVWTLPEGDADFSKRWALIKRGFSTKIAKGEIRSASRIAKGERGIWQRRFWEHTVRDEADFARHVDYVHFNPLSMVLSATPRIGLSHRFGAPWLAGFIQPIGEMENKLLANTVKDRMDEGSESGGVPRRTPPYSLLTQMV